MVSGKEGAVSTASLHCRIHVQRLRDRGYNAPQSSGSRGQDPWILRSTRLKWLTKNEPKAQTAAFLKLRQRCSEKSDNFSGVGGCQALSRTTQTPTDHRICRLEARTGTSPPPSFHHPPTGPPLHSPVSSSPRRRGPSFAKRKVDSRLRGNDV